MRNSFFADEGQLSKWVEAAETIEEEFGIDKALGYLIGEKETVEQKLQESDDKNTILSDKITSLTNKERKQLTKNLLTYSWSMV